ncbi:hypothetical protein CXG81DRAFT_10095, partial [Caulochytrium protostelioides]
LSEADRAFFQKYGRLPPAKKANHHLLKADRKYFDSGDYALSQAGKGSEPVGSQHPSPERIPHSVPVQAQSQASAAQQHLPAKESALVHESTPASGKV